MTSRFRRGGRGRVETEHPACGLGRTAGGGASVALVASSAGGEAPSPERTLRGTRGGTPGTVLTSAGSRGPRTGRRSHRGPRTRHSGLSIPSDTQNAGRAPETKISDTMSLFAMSHPPREKALPGRTPTRRRVRPLFTAPQPRFRMGPQLAQLETQIRTGSKDPGTGPKSGNGPRTKVGPSRPRSSAADSTPRQ